MPCCKRAPVCSCCLDTVTGLTLFTSKAAICSATWMGACSSSSPRGLAANAKRLSEKVSVDYDIGIGRVVIQPGFPVWQPWHVGRPEPVFDSQRGSSVFEQHQLPSGLAHAPTWHGRSERPPFCRFRVGCQNTTSPFRRVRCSEKPPSPTHVGDELAKRHGGFAVSENVKRGASGFGPIKLEGHLTLPSSQLTIPQRVATRSQVPLGSAFRDT